MTADPDLVRQAQQGEPEAFRALLARHLPSVRRQVGRFASGADVDDLVQEAFCSAFVRLNQLEDPERFTPWLSSVVRRTCQMWLRRRYVQLSLDDGAAENAIATASTADAHESDQQELVRSAVAAALAKLTTGQREAVRLHYLEGRDYRQTALRLQVPESAVRGRLERARVTLRRELADMEGKTIQATFTERDLQALRQATNFSAEAKPALNAVLLSAEGQLVATDRHRLFVYTSPGLQGVGPLLIQAQALRALRDEFPAAKQGELHGREDRAELRLPMGTRIDLSLLDEEYPLWENCIPQEWRTTASARCGDWRKTLGSVISMLESGVLGPMPEYPRVLVELLPEDRQIAVRLSGEVGNGVTEAYSGVFAAELASDSVEFAIAANPYYLRQAVEALLVEDDAMVELRANEPLRPFMFCGRNGEIRVVTMPMTRE